MFTDKINYQKPTIEFNRGAESLTRLREERTKKEQEEQEKTNLFLILSVVVGFFLLTSKKIF